MRQDEHSRSDGDIAVHRRHNVSDNVVLIVFSNAPPPPAPARANENGEARSDVVVCALACLLELLNIIWQ